MDEIVDGETVDVETGEVKALAAVHPQSQQLARPIADADMLQGGAPLSKKQDAILRAPTPRELVKKRPDGLSYVEQVNYRNRLHDAFGVGGWFWRMAGEPQVVRCMKSRWRDGKRVQVEVVDLCVHGRLYRWHQGIAQMLAESWGQAEYFPHENPATAMEKAKSDSITRCCKDLGMFAELWEKDWLEGKDHASEGPAGPLGVGPRPAAGDEKPGAGGQHTVAAKTAPTPAPAPTARPYDAFVDAAKAQDQSPRDALMAHLALLVGNCGTGGLEETRMEQLVALAKLLEDKHFEDKDHSATMKYLGKTRTLAELANLQANLKQGLSERGCLCDLPF